MSVHGTAGARKVKRISSEGQLPSEFLNCYEIQNASSLTWPIRTYKVVRADGGKANHLDRGKLKDVFWKLRKSHSHLCRGLGFVIDTGVDTIVVPDSWQVPATNITIGDYSISYDRTLLAQASNPQHSTIIEGIIREAVKWHFKNNAPSELGSLWQDYGDFCQMPQLNQRSRFHFCRRFNVSAKPLTGNRWVVHIVVNTSTLDAQTISDYYEGGKVGELAELIDAKQHNRLNRKNQPTAVRVWCDESTQSQDAVSVLDMADPDSVIAHGNLTRHEQKDLVSRGIVCQPYMKPSRSISMDHVRLILDSQITLDDHDETIIEPDERIYLKGLLRDSLKTANVFGSSLELSSEPFATTDIPSYSISPPPIRIRNKERGERVVRSPADFSGESIRQRSRYRAKQIREHGFLQSRPVNLLLATPSLFGDPRSKKLLVRLNQILEDQGIRFRFNSYVIYEQVEKIAREVESGGYSAALVVLPEGSRSVGHHDDTHEQVKRTLDIPTQCIHHDNTIPASWVDKSDEEFRAAQPRLAQRILERYQLCLGNLFVKCNWVPFAPAEPFHYNVHVGIDVGGRHNNTAMVCVGHGFSQRRGTIVFRPDQIPIEVQQAEPIPTQFLLAGLRQPFQLIEAGLKEAGSIVDFNKALFFRDGALLGDGDAWNELDALKELHSEFLRKGWVNSESVWTVIEVLKSAEGWRVMRNGPKMEGNPIVGRAIFPFEDDRTGLVCTTGQPYLTQGTARPLKIRIIDIHGHASREEIVRDLVWEADMCLSKPDMGMRLPWILHVADTGALQAARSYSIAGIPA